MQGCAIKAVAKAFHCSQNTISMTIFKITHHIATPDGMQRISGGGAKKKLDKHPEWVARFKGIASGFMASISETRASYGAASPSCEFGANSMNKDTMRPVT